MAIISGPDLDRLVRDLRAWYNTTRERLIEDLERDGYAYGNVKLSEEEQLFKYLSLTPRDHADMMERLLAKYRGRPDAMRRAGTDLQRYREKMERLKTQYEAQRGTQVMTMEERMADQMLRNALPPANTSDTTSDMGGEPYA